MPAPSLSLIKFCQHLSFFEGLILTHFFVIYHLFYIIHSVSQLSRKGESPTLKRTHIKAKDWKVELQMSTRHIPQKRILMSKLTETLSTQFEKTSLRHLNLLLLTLNLLLEFWEIFVAKWCSWFVYRVEKKWTQKYYRKAFMSENVIHVIHVIQVMQVNATNGSN